MCKFYKNKIYILSNLISFIETEDGEKVAIKLISSLDSAFIQQCIECIISHAQLFDLETRYSQVLMQLKSLIK